MNELDRIRKNQINDHSKILHVPSDLIDVAVYANIEKKYGRFLKTQIEHFPYMLKSQWRYFYGKSRATGHNALKDLVSMKVIGEENFQGCHYVYPLTRAMKWISNDAAAKPMDSKRKRNSDLSLMDNFMRAEYFLHTGKLIHKDPSMFFERAFWCRLDPHYLSKKRRQREITLSIKEAKEKIEVVKKQITDLSNAPNNQENNKDRIKKLIDLSQRHGQLLTEVQSVLEVERKEINEEVEILEKDFPPYVLPKVQPGAVANLSKIWKNKRVIQKGGFQYDPNTNEIIFKNSLEPFRFLESCLLIFAERSCYFENIQFKSNGIHYELVIIHYNDTNDNRYNQIINDMNLICDCFEGSSFSIRLLAENEGIANDAAVTIKRIVGQRAKRNKENGFAQDYVSEKEIRVYNTKIERYFFEGDSDSLFQNEDFSGLELVVSDVKDFL